MIERCIKTNLGNNLLNIDVVEYTTMFPGESKAVNVPKGDYRNFVGEDLCTPIEGVTESIEIPAVPRVDPMAPTASTIPIPEAVIASILPCEQEGYYPCPEIYLYNTLLDTSEDDAGMPVDPEDQAAFEKYAQDGQTIPVKWETDDIKLEGELLVKLDAQSVCCCDAIANEDPEDHIDLFQIQGWRPGSACVRQREYKLRAVPIEESDCYSVHQLVMDWEDKICGKVVASGTEPLMPPEFQIQQEDLKNKELFSTEEPFSVITGPFEKILGDGSGQEPKVEFPMMQHTIECGRTTAKEEGVSFIALGNIDYSRIINAPEHYTLPVVNHPCECFYAYDIYFGNEAVGRVINENLEVYGDGEGGYLCPLTEVIRLTNITQREDGANCPTEYNLEFRCGRLVAMEPYTQAPATVQTTEVMTSLEAADNILTLKRDELEFCGGVFTDQQVGSSSVQAVFTLENEDSTGSAKTVETSEAGAGAFGLNCELSLTYTTQEIEVPVGSPTIEGCTLRWDTQRITVITGVSLREGGIGSGEHGNTVYLTASGVLNTHTHTVELPAGADHTHKIVINVQREEQENA